MQDDNLQHMEYLLTKEAFDNWFAGLTADDKEAYENWRLKMSASDIFKYCTDVSVKSLKEFYLKEYGLPLDSVIKD